MCVCVNVHVCVRACVCVYVCAWGYMEMLEESKPLLLRHLLHLLQQVGPQRRVLLQRLLQRLGNQNVCVYVVCVCA